MYVCICIYVSSFVATPKRHAVRANAAVSRNINGTVCWPTIPITIAKAFLWIGSCFLHAVSAAAIPKSYIVKADDEMKKKKKKR